MGGDVIGDVIGARGRPELTRPANTTPATKTPAKITNIAMMPMTDPSRLLRAAMLA